MRTMSSAVSAALALAACASPAPPDRPPAEPQQDLVRVYTCSDGLRFSARSRGDSVLLSFPAGTAALPRVEAASGARYAARDTTFWSKGDSATLAAGGTRPVECSGRTAGDPWEEALLVGADFRAVGQEPGWVVELDEGSWLRYTGEYGAVRVYSPRYTRDTTVDGGVAYVARSDGPPLRVEIRERPCQDAMSGEAFTHEVRVRLGDQDTNGCGRVLRAEGIAEKYWKLVELRGRPVVVAASAREPHLIFHTQDSRVSGSTGCNSLSGSWERSGDALRMSRMATTLMACLDPALGAQERELLAVLEQVRRAGVVSDDLTLYDAGGSALARFAAVWLR